MEKITIQSGNKLKVFVIEQFKNFFQASNGLFISNPTIESNKLFFCAFSTIICQIPLILTHSSIFTDS